jgi:hypothetical protein
LRPTAARARRVLRASRASAWTASAAIVDARINARRATSPGASARARR